MGTVARMRTWRDVRRTAWLPPARRTVVVVPHPDDEALGTAGLILTQRRRGVPVVVVAVTDGEAAYPDAPPRRVAARRRREQRDSLAHLGVHEDAVVRLGLPDGGLTGLENELAAQLTALVRPDDLVVAPWHLDHHADHEACGRAARRAAHARGATLVGSLVWAPTRAPTAPHEVMVLALDRELCVRREQAVRAHRSQLEGLGGAPPVVGEELLDRLERDEEWYVAAPAAEGAAVDRSSAAFFEAMYRAAADPWNFASDAHERARYAELLSWLGPGPLGSVLEPGCSIGVLTAQLAVRARSVQALDVSPTAVARARRRCRDQPHVSVRVGTVPNDLPEDHFDVVVFAELGYYFDGRTLDAVADAIADRLTPNGRLVGTHWTGHSEDHAISGEAVHRRISARPGLRSVARARRPGFLVEEWRRRDRPR